MAENTDIEWAHHTANYWIGCTKVQLIKWKDRDIDWLLSSTLSTSTRPCAQPVDTL